MKLIQFVIILIFMAGTGSAVAEIMKIHLTNGQVVTYNTENIDSITYHKKSSGFIYSMDSRTDKYQAIGNGFGVLDNFELTGNIEIEKSYRNDGTSWAGFLIRADKESARHGKDKGYLCFIRDNGEVGIHSSVVQNVRNQKATGYRGNNNNAIKIVAYNGNIKVYINNDLILDEHGAYLTKGYISLNVGGARAKFRIKSLTEI